MINQAKNRKMSDTFIEEAQSNPFLDIPDVAVFDEVRAGQLTEVIKIGAKLGIDKDSIEETFEEIIYLCRNYDGEFFNSSDIIREVLSSLVDEGAF